MIAITKDVQNQILNINASLQKIKDEQANIEKYKDSIAEIFFSEILEKLSDNQKKLLLLEGIGYQSRKPVGPLLKYFCHCFNVPGENATEISFDAVLIGMIDKTLLEDVGYHEENKLKKEIDLANQNLQGLALIRCDGIGSEDGNGYFMFSFLSK